MTILSTSNVCQALCKALAMQGTEKKQGFLSTFFGGLWNRQALSNNRNKYKNTTKISTMKEQYM